MELVAYEVGQLKRKLQQLDVRLDEKLSVSQRLELHQQRRELIQELELRGDHVEAPLASTGMGYLTLEEVAKRCGAVSWVWPSWIPVGHVTLVAGPQDIGKSFFAAHIISVLTGAHSAWPDGSQVEVNPARVMLLDTEEFRGAHAERLSGMGVSGGQVVIPGDDFTHIPDLVAELGDISALAKDLGCGAIVVDSLSGGHGLDENSADMRKVLQGLAALASEMAIPIVCVHHVRKRSHTERARVTLDRVRGSTTITQFCRSVIAMYRLDDTDDAAPIRVEVIKSNFCRKPMPFGMLIENGGLRFVEAPEEARPVSAVDRAVEFLRVELAHEPQRYSDLLAKAETEGISKSSLYRARPRLGVVTVNGLWSLPSPFQPS
jgi:hypothetical protein